LLLPATSMLFWIRLCFMRVSTTAAAGIQVTVCCVCVSVCVCVCVCVCVFASTCRHQCRPGPVLFLGVPDLQGPQL
jgi:hypothetical protein